MIEAIADAMFSDVKKVLVVAVVATLAVVAAVAHFADYSLVKKGPSVSWIDQPFSMQRDAQGNPVAQIVMGLDDKGYVRWATRPLPASPKLEPAKGPLTKAKASAKIRP